MAQTYFHCAQPKFDIGTVICPGNWGRLIRTQYLAIPNGNMVPLPHREAVLEFARLAIARTKVSRLSCVFACETFESATQFRQAHQAGNIIYEVEPIGDLTGTHRANFDLTNLPQQGSYFDGVHEAARLYWTEEDPSNVEVLLPCSVKVVSLPEGHRDPAALSV
jgi:hypothetical protein